MNQKHELDRETIIGMVNTSNLIIRLSDQFFLQYGTTNVQFNILMILKNCHKHGVSQNKLSQELIVTKSNIVGLIDRMEKIGLVERKAHSKDRRINEVFITEKGLFLLKKVEVKYLEEIKKIMSTVTLSEKQVLMSAILKIRNYLENTWEIPSK